MARKDAKWTVMVYLAGDNNLTAECVYALTEMKRAKLGDQFNVIVQFDPKDDYLPTRRFEITKKPDPSKPLSLAPDNLLSTDLGGAPFEEKSENAHRRENARADALKQCQKAISSAASKSLSSQPITVSKETSSIKVSQKDIDKALEESIEFELLNNGAVSDDGETDTGSPVTLYNFMSYCVAKFPAEHYMVVLSGHGSGTVRDYLMKDESSDGSLTINELKRAFKDLQPELGGRERMIDILGLDSCLMSMAEVCYELKDLVQILIGCESYSPASGWPYREILERLARESSIQSKEPIQMRVAKGVVEEYVNFYTNYWLGGVSVDQSALDVTKAGKLKTHIDKLAYALTAKLQNKNQQAQKKVVDALITAHWEAQSYNGEQFVDLADFCRCLSARYSDKTIIALCKELAKFISSSLTDGTEKPLIDKPLTPNDNTYGNNAFVLRSCFNGPAYQYSYGVSIYFPWAKITPDYKELSFVKDTPDSGWAKFLETYTEMTRRSPRNINPADISAGDLASANFSLPQRFRMVEEMGPGNTIYSMRNPPIIVMPDYCIKGRNEIVEDMKKMFAKTKTSKQAQQQKRERK